MNVQIRVGGLLVLVLCVAILCTACGGADAGDGPSTETFYSEAAQEGMITKGTFLDVDSFRDGAQGRELRAGWNDNDYAMRAYLSFDVSSIIPSGDSLVIDKATVTVYESNTSNLPFNADWFGLYYLEYGVLEGDDYNSDGTFCAIIADSGYNTLKAYSVDVSEEVVLYFDPAGETRIQFCIRNHNTSDTTPSGLTGNDYWAIFAGSEVDLPEYRPKLVVEYHLE